MRPYKFVFLITLFAFAVSFGADPRQDLVNSFVKLQSAYPYRLTETTSTVGPVATESKRILEMEGAENFHMRWTEGKMETESIALNGKYYYKINGKWMDTPKSTPEASAQKNVDMNKVVEMVKNVKQVGTENLNGTQCTTYTFQLNAEIGMTGEGKAWVSLADGLPRKADMVLHAGEFHLKSILEYEYDGNIRIVAPAMN